MSRVMMFLCTVCQNTSEHHRCWHCGLNGVEIVRFRKSLPATDALLRKEFPQWTGEGVVTQ